MCTTVRFSSRVQQVTTSLCAALPIAVSIALAIMLVITVVPLSSAVAQNTAQPTQMATRRVVQDSTVRPMIGGSALLQVSPENITISGPSNGTVTQVFYIDNTGTGATTGNFSATPTGPIYGCSVSPGQAYVQAGGEVTVSVTCNTGLTGDGDISFRAYWLSGNNAYGDVSVQLPTAQPALSADHTIWYTAENASANYPWFHLLNNGRTAASYTLSVSECSGNISGCSVRSNPGTIASGGSADVIIDYHSGPGNDATGTMTLKAESPYGEVNTRTLTIVPLSANVSVTTNGSAGGGSAPFAVSDIGNSSPSTYNLGCSYSGVVTGCSVQPSVQVYKGSPQPVTVSYSTNGDRSGGSGSVSLRATYADGINTYTSQASSSVDVTPTPARLAVSTLFMNNDDQDMSLCAVSCFAATASHSTVPYYTLDTPRRLTLIYNGDRAFPRPFVYVDVSLYPGAGTVQQYWLEVQRNGVDIPFTNTDTKLIFTGTNQDVRLAGQVNMSSYSTGVYPITLLVTAVFTDGTREAKPVNAQLLVVNTQSSSIAKGWSIAGLQRLSYQPDAGGYLAEDGNGSATYYPSAYSTAADFTTLSLAGQVWTRAYPDGTKVLYNAGGFMTAVVDRLGHQTQFQYDASSRLSAVIEPMRSAGGTSTPYLRLAYDGNGLASITETGGTGLSRQTMITVNGNNVLTAIADPDLKATGFGYDGNGRLSTVTDRSGNATTYTYDDMWKLRQVTSPAVPVDRNDGTTAMQQPVVTLRAWQSVGVPTVSTATTLGTPVYRDTLVGRITDANGNTTTLEPDRWGQPLTIIDPVGNRTRITRLGISPVTVLHSDGSTDQTAFVDSTGNAGPYLTMSQPAGHEATYYHYGVAGQVDSVYGKGTVAEHRTLDAYGRPTEIRYGSDPSNKYQYAYDPATQRVNYTNDPGFHTANYYYDSIFGNLRRSVLPGNRISDVTFDAYGRLLVVSPAGALPRETVWSYPDSVDSWRLGNQAASCSFCSIIRS